VWLPNPGRSPSMLSCSTCETSVFSTLPGRVVAIAADHVHIGALSKRRRLPLKFGARSRPWNTHDHSNCVPSDWRIPKILRRNRLLQMGTVPANKDSRSRASGGGEERGVLYRWRDGTT
jgi:hypothetical protein